MIRRLLKALFVGTSEMILAVLLVLAFALVFFGLLLVVFPEGTGLVRFYGDFVDQSKSSARLRIHGRDDLLDSPIVAVLSRARRQVRDRPAQAVAWTRAKQGMDILDRHTIQTGERSGASIRFGEESELSMGENTLVVIKRPEKTGDERRHRASLVLLGGEVRGNLIQTSQSPEPLEIVTGSASSRILSQGPNEADFKVSVNPDRSSTLTVYSGVAEVTSEGQTARVESNRSVTVFPDLPPGEPTRVPDPPELEHPPEDHVEIAGSTAPEVQFGWSRTGDADAFHFSIARDPEFTDVVHSELTRDPEFTHGSLDAGRYYWRVSAFEGHAESQASSTRRFEIVRDVDPPNLQLSLPKVVETDRLSISGTTEPGTRIYIGDEVVPVGPEGEFEYTLILERGINMVAVEAVDGAGNSAYHSQYVNARFKATE